MPQELQVLRCCACESFQVHIVKKAKNWVCKICNQKQTTQMVYGRGSGKECRLIVQELNMRRLQLTVEVPTRQFELTNYPNNDEHLRSEENLQASRWSEFLELDDHNGSTDEKKIVPSFPVAFLSSSPSCNKIPPSLMENNVVPDTRTSELENKGIHSEYLLGVSPLRLDNSETKFEQSCNDDLESNKEVLEDYVCLSFKNHKTVIIKHQAECQASTHKRIIDRYDNQNPKKIKFDDLQCSASSYKEIIDYTNKPVILEDKENREMEVLKNKTTLNSKIFDKDKNDSNKLEKIHLIEPSSIFESEHFNVDDLYSF